MNKDQEEGFLVFVRVDRPHSRRPDAAERPVKRCASYAEARRVQREYLRAAQECVIRYQGEAGGGD
jgi:hypothetical protein